MAKKTRSPGQKLVPVPMREEFIAEIHTALPGLGYSDRSSFIRDAVVEKLTLMGYAVNKALAQAPSRIGKGGPKPKPKRSPREDQPAAEAPPAATVIEHKPAHGRGKAPSFGSSAVAAATRALTPAAMKQFPGSKPAAPKAEEAVEPKRAAAPAAGKRGKTPAPAEGAAKKRAGLTEHVAK